MMKNGQTNIQYSHRKIFKACLTIFHHYTWKGEMFLFSAKSEKYGA